MTESSDFSGAFDPKIDMKKFMDCVEGAYERRLPLPIDTYKSLGEAIKRGELSDFDGWKQVLGDLGLDGGRDYMSKMQEYHESNPGFNLFDYLEGQVRLGKSAEQAMKDLMSRMPGGTEAMERFSESLQGLFGEIREECKHKLDWDDAPNREMPAESIPIGSLPPQKTLTQIG